MKQPQLYTFIYNEFYKTYIYNSEGGKKKAQNTNTTKVEDELQTWAGKLNLTPMRPPIPAIR